MHRTGPDCGPGLGRMHRKWLGRSGYRGDRVDPPVRALEAGHGESLPSAFGSGTLVMGRVGSRPEGLWGPETDTQVWAGALHADCP